MDSDSAAIPGLILGEEAHIIARSEDGPRGREDTLSDVDGYANIILLCANDHKRIDSQPAVFTASRLRELKSDHEKWAAATFKGRAYEEPLRLIRPSNEDSVPFLRATTGMALWKLFEGTYARDFSIVNNDIPDESISAAEILLEACGDWADISQHVTEQGILAVREAQKSIQEMLDDVLAHGLRLYGRRIVRTLVGGGGPPTPWPIAQVMVLTPDQLPRPS